MGESLCFHSELDNLVPNVWRSLCFLHDLEDRDLDQFSLWIQIQEAKKYQWNTAEEQIKFMTAESVETFRKRKKTVDDLFVFRSLYYIFLNNKEG